MTDATFPRTTAAWARLTKSARALLAQVFLEWALVADADEVISTVCGAVSNATGEKPTGPVVFMGDSLMHPDGRHEIKHYGPGGEITLHIIDGVEQAQR